MRPGPGEAELRRAAIAHEVQGRHGSRDVQIDPDARVLPAEGGFHVQAWVWVVHEDLPANTPPR